MYLCLNMYFLKRIEWLFCFFLCKDKFFKRRKERKEKRKMQGNKLYVGNLSYSVSDSQLKDLFSNYGNVKEVTIIGNKGFGFVEMENPEGAGKAKEALNDSEFEGRTLKVDEARPRENRPQRNYDSNRGRQRGGYSRY